MHFLFLTRCYNSTNIQTIKENLRSIFNNQKQDTHHTYQQVLLVDMDRSKLKEEDFSLFQDSNTEVHFVYNKKDRFLAYAIDDYLETIEQENTYVYILDDDNLIKENFLDVCNYVEDNDIVIFKLENKTWLAGESILKGANAKTDWANCLTKLSIMKQYKVGCSYSHNCDGQFVDKVIKANAKVKILNEQFGYYNKLPKP